MVTNEFEIREPSVRKGRPTIQSLCERNIIVEHELCITGDTLISANDTPMFCLGLLDSSFFIVFCCSSAYLLWFLFSAVWQYMLVNVL